MELTVVTLFAAFSFLALVFCQNADINDCKLVPAAPKFNFDELIKYKYTYVLVPNTKEYRSYKGAHETSMKVEDKYYSLFNIIKNDGSQVSTNFMIDKVEGATLYQTIIENGNPTNKTVRITFYEYEPLIYAQFYACYSTGTEQDYRFGVIFGDNPLTDKVKQEMENNDKQYNFNGDLITWS